MSMGELIKARNSAMCLALGMLICNLVLILALYNKDQRIEIKVPPTLKSGFWAEGKKISASYQEEMALFLAHLMFDKNPVNQRFNHEIFLWYVAPSYQPALIQKFHNDEARYKAEGLSTIFYPATKTISKNIVRITGDLISTVGSKQVAKDKMTVEIGFKFIYGQWKVIKLVGVKKDEK